MTQDIKTHTGIVKEITVLKNGTSDKGKLWSLYKVTFEDGLEVTTFDGIYQQQIGEEITVYYVEEQNGQFTNRKIVDPNKPKRFQIDEQEWELLKSALRAITTKQDTILGLLKAPQVARESEPVSEDDTDQIDINNIPF